MNLIILKGLLRICDNKFFKYGKKMVKKRSASKVEFSKKIAWPKNKLLVVAHVKNVARNLVLTISKVFSVGSSEMFLILYSQICHIWQRKHFFQTNVLLMIIRLYIILSRVKSLEILNFFYNVTISGLMLKKSDNNLFFSC